MAGDPAGAREANVRTVADAGPVIHLAWINQLHVLDALFDEVLIPSAVRSEVLSPTGRGLGRAQIQAMLAAGRLKVQAPTTSEDTETPWRQNGRDRGELEALDLVEQVGADLFITDDARARAEALRREIDVTGTLGVLRTARDDGLIDAVLPLLIELRRFGQWLSESLIDQVRRDEGSR